MKELSKCVVRDAVLLQKFGWEKIVQRHRPRGDFALLDNVHHSAQRILKGYKTKRVSVRFSTEPWFNKKVDASLSWGAHQSCDKSIEFLCEEFVDMINKGQFVVLPANVARKLPGFRALLMEVIPQERQRD